MITYNKYLICKKKKKNKMSLKLIKLLEWTENYIDINTKKKEKKRT